MKSLIATMIQAFTQVIQTLQALIALLVLQELGIEMQEVVKLTKGDVLKKYGHLHVKLLSYYRYIFTYAVRYQTRERSVNILVTVGDGTPEAIYKTQIIDFERPVRLDSLEIADLEVYSTLVKDGVKLIEEYTKDENPVQ